jgi:hypothetical protein
VLDRRQWNIESAHRRPSAPYLFADQGPPILGKPAAPRRRVVSPSILPEERRRNINGTGTESDATNTESRTTRSVIDIIEERHFGFRRLGKPQALYTIQAHCKDMVFGIYYYNDERFSIMQTLILILTLILLYFSCMCSSRFAPSLQTIRRSAFSSLLF